MHKTLINEISENHLFPMTLMLEYRSGSLDKSIHDRIYGILQDNLSKQTELLLQEPYKSLILDNPITQTDLDKWKIGSLNSPKRRIAVDQYIKASLANLFENKELTKIHELNQFVFLHRFEAYAKHYPDQPAFLYKMQTLTYSQVNARANQLAHFLLKQKEAAGLDPSKEFIIGTFLPREPEWIIAILAIWKAGAAFIAIDPTAMGNSPDSIDDYFEKFAQTISDANPAFIITHSDHQYLLPKPNTKEFICVCLDECEQELEQSSSKNTDITIDPEALAYILYTSGSTGKPKGVEIAHRGFMPCLEAHRECVDLTRDSIMAQYATCDFDAWVAEMLILGVGGTLAIVPSDIRLDETRCARYYHDHKINIVIFTPAFLNKLGGHENFPLWRALFIVGESFDWELVKKWKTEKLQIVNGYGLTETTICATLENLDIDDVGKPLSIGKPILGTKILIKIPKNIDINNPDIEKDYGPETTYQDPESSSSAIDLAGEPWFGGISLTRGYRGEAMQNNAWRFVEIEGVRYYKSGDKAILRADGRLEHQGRYSRMIKVNGKRIELESIESNLIEHKPFKLGKMDVVVSAVGKSIEDKNFTTILVFIEKAEPTISNQEIQQFIISKEKNIDKELPPVILWRKSFPKTSSKINRAELNKSYFEALSKKVDNFFIPELLKPVSRYLFSAFESLKPPVISAGEVDIFNKLKDCWSQTILTENLQLEDDFFLIGGRSIDISPLIQRIRKAFPENKQEITNDLVLECKTLLSQTKRIYSLQYPVELIPLKKNQNTDAPYVVFCPPSILGDPEQDYTVLFSQRDHITGKPIFDECFQVHGLIARGVKDPSLMPSSIYSIALDYALTIKNWVDKNNKSNIPIFILGWSSGGTLTPEIVNALEKYDIHAYAYVCDSVAPFPFHHFNHEEHTRELVLLASKLGQSIGLKIETQDLKSELSKIQKPRDRITHCFDYLIQKAKINHRNILNTAKIIRLAEHNYIIRAPLNPIRLYKAKKYLLNDILTEDKAHYWPKKSIHKLSQLEENMIEGDHFEMIRQPALAQQITTKIIRDFTYHKLKKLTITLETQANYVIPYTKMIEPTLKEYEQKNNPTIIFSKAIFDFLENPKKIALLLIGESGIGKSLTAKQLEDTLKTIGIPIKTIVMNRYTCEELRNGIREELKEWSKESNEIRILILEGYDERQGNIDFNYYNTNGLSEYQNLKVIHTCRSETLKENYISNFIPGTQEKLELIKLLGFTETQVKALMSIHLAQNNNAPDRCELDKLYQEITSLNGVIELIKNPLQLTFVLKALPKIRQSAGTLTRFKIYEAFNQDYFERGEQKVKSQSGVEQNQNFQLACRLHCQKIALAFFAEELTSYESKQNKGKSLISASKNVSSRLDDLFDSKNKDLLKALPLDSNNNIHQFKHKSQLEYFVSDALITTLKEENIDFNELQNWFIENKILPKKLVSNDSIIKFWAEGYRQYPTIKRTLDKIVTDTRTNEQIKTLGGIAITLLNMAGEFFNGANLRGIRVPGAVLNGGYFDCADFTGSDLTDVHFYHAWLRNTRLVNCQLKGVNFTQNPRIPNNATTLKIISKSLPKDGQHKDLHMMIQTAIRTDKSNRVVTSINSNSVFLWEIESKNCIQGVMGYGIFKTRVDLTAMSNRIINESNVRVAEAWSPDLSARTHTGWVSSVYLSNDAKTLVSGGDDHTVRVWNITSGQFQLLMGHTAWVSSVHLSSNARIVASGSWDKTVRVWDMVSGQSQVLRGHEKEIHCVYLCSDGSTLISGSEDNTVQVWDIASERSKVLQGHTDAVLSVYLSDNRQIAASGSRDKTARVWNLANDESLLLEHQQEVNGLHLSSDGRTVTSSCGDMTVRVWDISSGQAALLQMHNSATGSVNLNNNLEIAAFGSWINVWGLESGSLNELGRILTNSNIISISIQKDSSLLAIGLENGSIQVWKRMHKKENEWQLMWSSRTSNSSLILAGCDITGCTDLSPENKDILSKHGAIDNCVSEKKDRANSASHAISSLQNSRFFSQGTTISHSPDHEAQSVKPSSNSLVFLDKESNDTASDEQYQIICSEEFDKDANSKQHIL